MTQFVMVRDQDRGAVVQPARELGADEDLAALVGTLRARFAPPQYEVVIGVGDSLEAFVRSYPRYGASTRQSEGRRDGGPEDPAEGEGNRVRDGAARGGGGVRQPAVSQ